MPSAGGQIAGGVKKILRNLRLISGSLDEFCRSPTMGALPLRDVLSAAEPESAPQISARDLLIEVERHQRALEEKPGDFDTILSAAKFCHGLKKVQEASAL